MGVHVHISLHMHTPVCIYIYIYIYCEMYSIALPRHAVHFIHPELEINQLPSCFSHECSTIANEGSGSPFEVSWWVGTFAWSHFAALALDAGLWARRPFAFGHQQVSLIRDSVAILGKRSRVRFGGLGVEIEGATSAIPFAIYIYIYTYIYIYLYLCMYMHMKYIYIYM